MFLQISFETPTPLPEHAEREFGFSADKLAAQGAAGQNSNSSSGLDDSGIELQEE